MSSVLARTYQATEQGIRQAVKGVQKGYYLPLEKVEEFHRCLVAVVHADSEKAWKLAKWK